MASVGDRLGALRERHGWVDHVVRMQQHYGASHAGQQAGAITYFAFLSFFPVLALAFFTVWLLSSVLDGADDALRTAITSLFPEMIGPEEGQLQLRDFRNFSGLAGLVGLAGVLYSGLGWISALRQALTTVFQVPEDEQPGFVAGKFSDLVALVSIGLTLLVAVAVSGLVSGFSTDLLGWAGLDQELSWLVQLLTVALGLAANAVLFFDVPPARRRARASRLAGLRRHPRGRGLRGPQAGGRPHHRPDPGPARLPGLRYRPGHARVDQLLLAPGPLRRLLVVDLARGPVGARP